MSERRPRTRVPQVNLFAEPPRGLRLGLSDRGVGVALIALIVLVWLAVGAGIAMLFGWHPSVGASP